MKQRWAFGSFPIMCQHSNGLSCSWSIKMSIPFTDKEKLRSWTYIYSILQLYFNLLGLEGIVGSSVVEIMTQATYEHSQNFNFGQNLLESCSLGFKMITMKLFHVIHNKQSSLLVTWSMYNSMTTSITYNGVRIQVKLNLWPDYGCLCI